MSEELKAFGIDPKTLDFALWRSVHWGHVPEDRQECYIRNKQGLVAPATYYAPTNLFGIGPDGEAELHEVQWQPQYPKSVIEQAARNYAARAAPDAVIEGLVKATTRLRVVVSRIILTRPVACFDETLLEVDKALAAAEAYIKGADHAKAD